MSFIYSGLYTLDLHRYIIKPGAKNICLWMLRNLNMNFYMQQYYNTKCVHTRSCTSLWEWAPDASMAANIVRMCCWMRLMPDTRQLRMLGNPTLSITLWKAPAKWRVILHRAWEGRRREDSRWVREDLWCCNCLLHKTFVGKLNSLKWVIKKVKTLVTMS